MHASVLCDTLMHYPYDRPGRPAGVLGRTEIVRQLKHSTGIGKPHVGHRTFHFQTTQRFISG